jgi:hypothetical protein
MERRIVLLLQWVVRSDLHYPLRAVAVPCFIERSYKLLQAPGGPGVGPRCMPIHLRHLWGLRTPATARINPRLCCQLRGLRYGQQSLHRPSPIAAGQNSCVRRAEALLWQRTIVRNVVFRIAHTLNGQSGVMTPLAFASPVDNFVGESRSAARKDAQYLPCGGANNHDPNGPLRMSRDTGFALLFRSDTCFALLSFSNTCFALLFPSDTGFALLFCSDTCFALPLLSNTCFALLFPPTPASPSSPPPSCPPW